MEITISDVSLRQTGKETNTLSFKEKLDVFKNLCELGVNVIEVGPAFSGKADEVLVKTLSGVAGKTTVACVCTNESETEKAFSLISLAKSKRLIVEVPVSPVRMEYSFGKKPQVVLEHLKNTTEKAVSLCDEVEVSLSDATRAEKVFLTDCIKTAITSGAKIITLCDEAGLTYPQEFGEFISGLYQSVPELKNVKFCVSCSNDLAMGTANTLTAILNGATGIKTCAVKKHELISIGSFSALCDAVLFKKGYSTTLNKTGLMRIIKRFNTVKSDEDVESVDNQKPVESISESLSRAELGKIVKKLGYDLSADDLTAVHSEYKRISASKKVGVKEIEAIIASTALQVPPTYVLERFSVQSSNVIAATANVVLKKDGKEVFGLSCGNGAIDAAFFALENIVGRRFELDDFQISSVTEGKEAVGEAVVKLRFDGKIYSGRGISTDIVGASIRAYVAAVNKIVYEESNK
ncbi:MAG: alpha-isopropylmalate synthase regulatory domain-containing protein [Clostridia bacterium]|nr:alpha-isopropylmalate synthase regulatory domain-containing protein [Clostridia bacterium]